MSIVDWALANAPVAGSITGASAIIGGSALIVSSNVQTDSSYHLFKKVPESKTGNESWSQVMDGKDFSELPVLQRSYQDLLKGDRSYNEGNYVIYYGSEACPHCTHFMFNNPHIANGTIDPKLSRMSEGTWMKTYEFTKNDPVLKKLNIKFLMYEDIPDREKVDKNEAYWTLPWTRWPQDIPKHKIKKGDNVRNDQSAVDMRNLMDYATEVFGHKKVGGTPTVIVYKNGVGKVFNQDPLVGLVHEKQGEEMNNTNQLMNYIKYYYVTPNA